MGSRGHGHDIEPVWVAEGITLDITQDDLGHPERPGLWEELHGHCPEGTLVCATCGMSLYLQERPRVGYVRQTVCEYRPGQISGDWQPESPEHQAFKSRIATVADREGFGAEVEARSADGTRVTDVVVHGPDVPVGWEVQLSPISAAHVHRRRGLAIRDNLTPSWICTSPSSQVVDRVPHGVVHEHTARRIENVLDLRIRSGYRRIELRRCTGPDRSAAWHRGRRCQNWHGQPVGVDPEDQPTFDDLVRKTASGQIVAVRWPRPTRFRKEFWLWAPHEDAQRLWETDLDAAPVTNLIPAQPDGPRVGFVRSHIARPLERDEPNSDGVVPRFERAPVVVWGTSAAGWSTGQAPHQRCSCGNPAPPRADGRCRTCPDCASTHPW